MVLILVCLVLFCGLDVARGIPTPNWERIPTFAFPGASDVFMTNDQVKGYAGNFSAMLIWGFNASCVTPNGFSPAQTSGSTYWCPSRDNVNFSTFAPWMQTSLDVQGASLKAVGGESYPVFGYVESMQSQASYASGQTFLEHPEWWLRLSNVGVVECVRDGCDWQGPALRQYDHRQAAVREFFTSQVLMETAGGAHLDGVFLDVVDAWPTGLCSRWKCTPQESSDLASAALTLLQSSLETLRSAGKSAIVSLHSRPYSTPDTYWPMRAALESAGNAMRFYEFFGKSNLQADFFAMLNESEAGIPLAVHTPIKTLNPDWVELAAFLVAANNQSMFCFSSGWTLEDSWWQPEFAHQIGYPISPPIHSQPPSSSSWTTLPNTNLIYKGVNTPRTSNPPVYFLGNATTFQACQLLANASSLQLEMITFVDADGASYANQCYGRTDLSYHPVAENSCTSARSPNVPGGTYTRLFQHANVTFNTDTNEAHINFL